MTIDARKKTRSYLGDAVYVELTQYGVKLTTEDGIRAYNTIEMEPEVLQSFIDWMKQNEVIK